VDSGVGVGKYNSLALDSNGNPHIAYAEGGSSSGSLKYAKKWLGSWGTPQTVDTTGGLIQHISLALDANDRPHIAYFDTAFQFFIHHTYWTSQPGQGSYWALEFFVADQGNGACCQDISLALDANATPHISYYDAVNNRLQYVTKSGAAQVIETPDPWAVWFGIDHGRYSSITLDANGKPRISYYVTGASLRYVKGS
jgi:hypothetical protein